MFETNSGSVNMWCYDANHWPVTYYYSFQKCSPCVVPKNRQLLDGNKIGFPRFLSNVSSLEWCMIIFWNHTIHLLNVLFCKANRAQLREIYYIRELCTWNYVHELLVMYNLFCTEMWKHRTYLNILWITTLIFWTLIFFASIICWGNDGGARWMCLMNKLFLYDYEKLTAQSAPCCDHVSVVYENIRYWVLCALTFHTCMKSALCSAGTACPPQMICRTVESPSWSTKVKGHDTGMLQ